MNTDKYIELRRSFKELHQKIFLSEDIGDIINIAGKKLGFLVNDTMIFESESESTILMDDILYEKNGQKDSLLERYAHNSNDLTENEEILLNGMVHNHLSLFEITRFHPPRHVVEMIDLIGGEQFTLMDLGMSKSPPVGHIIFSRIYPIDDVYISSGLVFLFLSGMRELLLNEISKKGSFHIRKRRPKVKAKKEAPMSLTRKMLLANRRWGVDIGFQDV